MSKLDETRHFLDLYLHHCGDSEIPRQWHLFSAIALLASAVQDRVWVQKDASWKLKPNLYVFLIGEGGSGKDFAIERAVDLAMSCPRLAQHVTMGRATREAIIDFLSGRREKEEGLQVLREPKLWYVTTELGSSIHKGERGEEFITFMTEIYTKKRHDEATRMHGPIRIENPTISWIAGSTPEWLRDSIPRNLIEGGFFARTLPVQGTRSTRRRYRMTYPDDVQEVRAHLQQRIEDYACLEGAFTFSPEADAAAEAWYVSRPEPEHEKMRSIENRADELISRLALVFRLAEMEWTEDRGQRWAPPAEDRQISKANWEEAKANWETLRVLDMPFVAQLVGETKETADVGIVRRILKKRQEVPFSKLLKLCYSYGMNRDRVLKALEHLRDEEEALGTYRATGGRHRQVWTWTGGSEEGETRAG